MKNSKMFMMMGMMMVVVLVGMFVVGGGVFMQGKLSKPVLKCAEPYHKVKSDLESQYYAGYKKAGVEGDDWYACELDDNMKNGVGLKCPSGWNFNGYSGGRYTCFVAHDNRSVPSDPNNPGNSAAACSVGYKMSLFYTLKKDEWEMGEMFGPKYSSWLSCEKQNIKPNFPCRPDFEPLFFGNSQKPICIKSS